MSVFNIIGFLLIAGITISAVASAGTDEPGQNKCDKSSHQTKYENAKNCIDAVIKNISGEPPGKWNATAYCESKSNLTGCLTDCFNGTIAGKIIEYTCSPSNSSPANQTDAELIQQSKELLLVQHVNDTRVCLNSETVENNVKAALKNVPNVAYTSHLSKIIIGSQPACGVDNSTAITTPKPSHQTGSASVINVALITVILATCVPGYF